MAKHRDFRKCQHFVVFCLLNPKYRTLAKHRRFLAINPPNEDISPLLNQPQWKTQIFFFALFSDSKSLVSKVVYTNLKRNGLKGTLNTSLNFLKVILRGEQKSTGQTKHPSCLPNLAQIPDNLTKKEDWRKGDLFS